MSLEDIFPIEKWNLYSKTILDHLPEEDFKRMMARAKTEKYGKGEIIFREGTQPLGIYHIQEGKVKRYKIDNFGKEQIIYIAGKGELIGYNPVMALEVHSDSAATLEESRITFIPVRDFLEVLETSVELTKQMLKALSHEAGVLINNITVFAQRPVRERLAIALIILTDKFKDESAVDGQPIAISISRDDIANMAATTRENVTRFIAEFKKEGIIETIGRKIIIIDIRKLVGVSNYK